jgi:hypothetical protein
MNASTKDVNTNRFREDLRCPTNQRKLTDEFVVRKFIGELRAGLRPLFWSNLRKKRFHAFDMYTHLVKT